VLGVLDAEQLARAMFPLGDTRKSDVRAEAERRGLAVADKADSHDICFIADGDTRGWLQQRLGSRPGDIRDEAGELVGSHDGTYGFTVGQRKGMRIGRPAPDGRPRYVLDLQPATGTVVVGPADSLDVRSVVAHTPRWCADPPSGPVRVLAQVRAHGKPVPATASLVGAAVEVVLDVPLRGVAPGQAVVLYDGTRVLGSATITASRG
jgi:tRNA-specific 2-thiouridylase